MNGEKLIKCDICNETKTRKEFYITTKDNPDVESNECDECSKLSHENKIELINSLPNNAMYFRTNNEESLSLENQFDIDSVDEDEFNLKNHQSDIDNVEILINETDEDRKNRREKEDQNRINKIQNDKERIPILNKKLEKFKTLKLQMIAIPSENSKNTLQQMLSKKDWDNIRNQIIEQYDHKCAICNKQLTKFNCHEMWEFDDINSIQSLKKCIPLCHLCHCGIHPDSTNKNNVDIYDIITNFCKINNCTHEIYSEYKKYIIELSILRSTTRWYTNDIWKMNYGEYELLVKNKLGNVNEKLINKKKNSIFGGDRFNSFKIITDVNGKVTKYGIDKDGNETLLNNDYTEIKKNLQHSLFDY